MNVCGRHRNTQRCLSCCCLCYRRLKARTGTSPENGHVSSDHLAAVGKHQPERGGRPFPVPVPPPPGDTEQLAVGGGHRPVQGVNKARRDGEEQRAAALRVSEGTQGSTSCHGAGRDGLGHNENRVATPSGQACVGCSPQRLTAKPEGWFKGQRSAGWASRARGCVMSWESSQRHKNKCTSLPVMRFLFSM